jgi:hypothetical protein
MTKWNYEYVYDHDAIKAYLNTIQEGERVVETEGCMSGMEGTVVMLPDHYDKNSLCRCVKWDHSEAMGGQMTTSITGGTRRLDDKGLDFKIKEMVK